MKRNTCIQTIKNQINAKISAHTSSDRDFIVFRPKSYGFNPILTNHRSSYMGSIIQLQNKRKHESSIMRLKYQSRQRSDQNEDLQNHLKIKKCRTSKKMRLISNQHTNSHKKFELGSFRQRAIKTEKQKFEGLTNKGSMRSTKKEKSQILQGLQKKKIINSFTWNQNNSRILEQKQNYSKTLNFRRLKPYYKDQESVDLSYLSMFKERIKETEKLRISLSKGKQTHKRIFTQIPSILFPKSPDKMVLKCNKTFQHVQFEHKQKRNHVENHGFQPWQTSGETCDNPVEILNQQSLLN